MKDDTNPDRVKSRLKIKKVKASGIHLDSQQLCTQVAIYVKAIGEYER